MHRNAVRRLLPVLGLCVIVVLGVAIWSSTTGSRPDSPTPTPAPRSAAATASGVPNQVRTISARGSSAGYDATVQITRTDVGATTVTTLDIVLTTQATPASAPTAEAQLTGPDRVRHNVALTIIGPGHWRSKQFAIAAGRYTLTSRFDRRGRPVIIPVNVVLT